MGQPSPARTFRLPCSLRPVALDEPAGIAYLSSAMRPGIPLFPSRRRALAYATAGLASGASYLHGTTLERHWIEIVRHRLPIALGPSAPPALRVALLTDFHYDPLFEGAFFESAVALANRERPDLILLLGDYITSVGEAAPEILSILGKLRAPMGVKAVLGNHDCSHGRRSVTTSLDRNGIELLRDRLVRLRHPAGTLVLAGFDSAWTGLPDPGLFKGLHQEERLLLAHHEPDPIAAIPLEWRDKIALQVSGHTHGGQICAPGGIVLRTVPHGVKYTRGLYRISPRTNLYVSRGLGTVAIHARLFCRPEITILDLINT